ncbi:MAG: alginate O-acetyltransferase AlgF [Pseudomonadota bacterium]
MTLEIPTMFQTDRRTVLLGLTATALLPLTATAQEGGLYDAPPPPGSAFVRVVDATQGTNREASIGGQQTELSADWVSDYLIIPGGDHAVQLGAATGNVTLDAGEFYTVVMSDNGARLVADDVVKNPARAGLYFYNLSEADTVTLAAELKGKSAPIFQDVQAGAKEFREVNALDVTLKVMQGENALVQMDAVALRRKGGFSVFYFGDGQAAWITNGMAG